MITFVYHAPLHEEEEKLVQSEKYFTFMDVLFYVCSSLSSGEEDGLLDWMVAQTASLVEVTPQGRVQSKRNVHIIAGGGISNIHLKVTGHSKKNFVGFPPCIGT